MSRAIEQLESVLAKQDDAEERKAIDSNLDNLNAYFQSLQEAETALEEALTNAKPEDISEEVEEKKEALVQKASTIKRRLAASIRFEMRKVHQNRGA